VSGWDLKFIKKNFIKETTILYPLNNKVELVSKSYYKESLLDNFVCSSYVQQHRFSTICGKKTQGMDICRTEIAAKTEKKNSILFNFFKKITVFPNFFAD
jgi:hypothetical protein